MNFLKTCEFCGKEFEPKTVRQICCCMKCSRDLNNQRLRDKKREENNIKYSDVSDIPTCKICGWKSRSLQNHLKTHNLTVQEYREQYNATNEEIFHSSYIDEKRDRITGDKNPGYQHGGTRSSFSKNNNKYAGLTEEEKQEKIKKQITKSNNSKRQNNSYATTIEYYTTRGFTEAEAIELRKQRQTTFSLEKCIEKYGEEVGRETWIARQEKWLSSDGIKTLKSGVSSISQELFDAISPYIKHNHYYATNGIPGVNNEYKLRTNNGVVLLDFFVPGIGKIIEFDGDYWHSDANPRKISREVRDAKIIQKYPQFNILHVWEKDYKSDKEGTIKRCLEFLNE